MRSNMTMWMVLLGLALPGAARADEILVRVEVPPPRLEVDARGHTRVRIDGFENPGAPGRPALPARALYVLLPAGHEVVSVEAAPAGLVPLAGEHLVAPGQKEYPPSHRGPRPATPSRDGCTAGGPRPTSWRTSRRGAPTWSACGSPRTGCTVSLRATGGRMLIRGARQRPRSGSGAAWAKDSCWL